MVSQQSLRVAMVGIGGLIVGTGLGYMVAERRLSSGFEQRLKRETEEMREFYTIHRKKYPTPELAVKELVAEQQESVRHHTANGEVVAYHKIVKKEYQSDADTEGDSAVVAEFDDQDILVEHNVFQTKRDPNKPYIISQEEFLENDPGYVQSTLTYYEVDHVLSDERDDPIEDIKDTVGEKFRSSFGIGSSDENIVHIRNEKLQLDFEIQRSEGSFAKEVLGIDDPEPDPRRSSRQRRGE